MAERVLRGRAASGGVAAGPLVRLGLGTTAAVSAGDPQSERARLLAAVARARDELEALAAGEDSLGTEILAFQVALLEDPELAADAFAAVARGAPAARAWAEALEVQIGAYAAAEDEQFRARAADIADLRDRVLAALAGSADALELPPGAIVADRDLTPSRFLALDRQELGGVALEAGSPLAHVAVLARARGVPLVTGLGAIAPAPEAILDGEEGLLILCPGPETRRRHARASRARAAEARAAAGARHRPAVTRGGERVEVMLNLDDPEAVQDDLLAASDGVGLWRTEFLFLGRDRPPDEEEQYRACARLLDRLAGKPLLARTLDAGGDKPVPGVSLPREANPFLGLRGIRLCLERPELFRPQARALLRAAARGPLKVMLPMVATAGEVAEARAFFAACLAELRAEGVPAALPPIGIMVETPAAALTLDLLDADFGSIGTNDLAQYALAAARDGAGRVAALLDPLHPAVRRLIARAVQDAAAKGMPVSLCGDAASDPAATGELLALGLRRLSVAPAALGAVKLAVARHG